MIKFIIARGIGFSPGSSEYIVTGGFSTGESEASAGSSSSGMSFAAGFLLGL